MPEPLILTAAEVGALSHIISHDPVLIAAFPHLQADGHKAGQLLKGGMPRVQLRNEEHPEQSPVVDPLNARQFLKNGRLEDDATWQLRLMVMQASWAQNPAVDIPERNKDLPSHAWKQEPFGQFAFQPRGDGSYEFTGDEGGRKLVERLKFALSNRPPVGTTGEDAKRLERVINGTEKTEFPLTCDLMRRLKNNPAPTSSEAKAAFGLRYLLWANLNHLTYLNLANYLASAGQLGFVQWVKTDRFSHQHNRNWGLRCPSALPEFGYAALRMANPDQHSGDVMNHLAMSMVFPEENTALAAEQEVQVLWGELRDVEKGLEVLKACSKGDDAVYQKLLSTFIEKIDLNNTCVTGRFKVACAWAKNEGKSYEKLYALLSGSLNADDSLNPVEIAKTQSVIQQWLADDPSYEMKINGKSYIISSQINEIIDLIFEGMGLDPESDSALMGEIKKAILPSAYLISPVEMVPPPPPPPPISEYNPVLTSTSAASIEKHGHASVIALTLDGVNKNFISHVVQSDHFTFYYGHIASGSTPDFTQWRNIRVGRDGSIAYSRSKPDDMNPVWETEQGIVAKGFNLGNAQREMRAFVQDPVMAGKIAAMGRTLPLLNQQETVTQKVLNWLDKSGYRPIYESLPDVNKAQPYHTRIGFLTALSGYQFNGTTPHLDALFLGWKTSVTPTQQAELNALLGSYRPHFLDLDSVKELHKTQSMPAAVAESGIRAFVLGPQIDALALAQCAMLPNLSQQIASQFNLNESTDPVAPVHPVNYFAAGTQGERAQIAEPILAMARYHHLYSNPLSDCLMGWRGQSITDGSGIAHTFEQLFEMGAGYLKPALGKEALALDFFNAHKDKLKITFEETRTKDANGHYHATFQFNCAAISLGFYDYNWAAPAGLYDRTAGKAALDALCAGMLQTQYALAAHAMVAVARKNPDQRFPMVLTFVGGGVFGNTSEAVAAGILAVKDILKRSGVDNIDLCLSAYGLAETLQAIDLLSDMHPTQLKTADLQASGLQGAPDSRKLTSNRQADYVMTRFEGEHSGFRLTRQIQGWTETVDMLDNPFNGNQFFAKVDGPRGAGSYSVCSDLVDVAFLAQVLKDARNAASDGAALASPPPPPPPPPPASPPPAMPVHVALEGLPLPPPPAMPPPQVPHTPADQFEQEMKTRLGRAFSEPKSPGNELAIRVGELIELLKDKQGAFSGDGNTQLKLLESIVREMVALYQNGQLGEKVVKGRFFNPDYPYAKALETVKSAVFDILTPHPKGTLERESIASAEYVLGVRRTTADKVPSSLSNVSFVEHRKHFAPGVS